MKDEGPEARPERAAAPAIGLEQALWRTVTGEAGADERMLAWLSLLSEQVEGMAAGTVVLARHDALAPVALWPSGRELPGELAALAQDVVTSARPMTRPVPDSHATDLAIPAVIEGEVRGVVAIRVARQDGAGVDTAFRALRWGIAWVREHLVRENLVAARAARDHAQLALRVFAATLEERRLRPAVMALVTELSQRFDCARVSLGFLRRGTVKVYAISETARFGKQMNLARLIGGAMDEAIDQRSAVDWPVDPEEPISTEAHERLARGHGAGAVLTMPLFDSERFIGAITLERRSDGAPFTAEERDAIDFVASCITPMLADKRENDRWVPVRMAHSLWAGVTTLLGPRHVKAKLIAVALVAATAFLSTYRTDYAVPADARIDGVLRRAVVAPFDGFIAQAPVRPGDTVAEGDLLLALDDRELALERFEAVTEQRQQQQLYDKALGERNRAELGTIRARIDRAAARIAMIDDRLSRVSLSAPFAGLVISGDLSPRIGGAVRKGEQLLEIAPLDDWKVVLQVDERQLDDVAVGQTGQLIVTSMPDESFAFEVTRITPLAEPVEGRVVFAVEAKLTGDASRLRPGMEGVGRIAVDKRYLVDIWTRPARDWFELFLWRWVP